MSTDNPYTIADLARLTGVTPRTVRYYVAQGLLPGPDATGRGAHYDDGHLARLQLTRRLQRQHLPLAEIRARLSTMTDDDIAGLASTNPEPNPPSTSALEYIRTVLGSAEAAATEPPPPFFAVAEAPPMPLLRRRALAAPGAPSLSMRESQPFPASGLAPTAPPVPPAPSMDAPDASPTPPPEPPSLERSQWERLSLGPNVELHIRRPLSRHEQRRIDRLITIARQVLKEGQP